MIARRAEIVTDFEALVGAGAVIADEDGRRAFETDALTAYKRLPLAVVLPRTTDEVAQVLKYCYQPTASRWCRAEPARRCAAARCPPRMPS